MRFRIVKGETEHITLRGRRVRNPTVLLQVGTVSLSWKAALLGTALVVLQIADGILTFAGVSIWGSDMEGNAFLRQLVATYGAAKALFFVKTAAIASVIFITFRAHRRRWIRPLILLIVALYLILAVAPWIIILSSPQAAP